ncbi:MAG: amidase, partial [Gammaproteobacteria bacterium]|nr:amidase [Gammaproteobacteria bacterium]
MLEVMAGRDGLDPRQQQVETHPYTEALGQDLNGLRVGVLHEGFGWEDASHGVEAVVKLAADHLRALGATVEPVSVPMHRQAMAIWVPIMVEGVTDVLLHGNALGTNWRGLYQTSLLDVHAGWRLGANLFPDGLKSFAVLAEVVRDTRRGHYYAKAQNLSRQLRAAYDAALEQCDVLLLPTSPVLPPALPPLNPNREEMMSPGFAPIMNTAPFDCTGHPAISVPCGLLDGLPVGMMLVGRCFDESTLYRLADAYERHVDWRTGAGP